MRIAARPLGSYPWYLRPFFWNQRRKYGRVLDAALLWARVPKLFLGVAGLYGAIDRKSSPIEPALRSLLTVRVSQISHCRFCVDINGATLLRRGVSEDKLWALENWRTSNLFDGRERVALDYAEAMTYSDRDVDDELVARVRQHFDDDGVIELSALIAFQNMSSKFNAALAVPAQGFCRLPAQPGKMDDENGNTRNIARDGSSGRVVGRGGRGEHAPYAGWQDREIKALSATQIDDLRSGRGMGLALAAELNGYPGPRHVLDLTEELDLTREQQAEAQRLIDEMQAQVIVLGEQVIAGEAALEELFASGTVSDAAIETMTVEIGRLQGALRAHHLRYHIAMRALLSPHQVMRYQRLRGYAAEGGHGHGGTGHTQ